MIMDTSIILTTQDDSIGDTNFLDELPNRFPIEKPLFSSDASATTLNFLIEIPEEVQVNTSGVEKILSAYPSSIPTITGVGAKIFLEELENMQYSNEIKELYNGSKELVERLNIFKDW